jgi:hypothetical protein
VTGIVRARKITNAGGAGLTLAVTENYFGIEAKLFRNSCVSSGIAGSADGA